MNLLETAYLVGWDLIEWYHSFFFNQVLNVLHLDSAEGYSTHVKIY